VQEHVKREKSLMADCDSPFLTNLVSSFKDNTHLYLLLESVMGGELFTYLQVCLPYE
jgi:serine/threonine protein kinase